MKLILQRRMLMNGALTGTLSVEHRNEYGRLSGIEKICDTMERKNGQLPTGEYRVVIGKCSRFARQMIFLEPIREDSSSSSSLPLPETCKRCRMERKSHEFGCLEQLYALPCPMMQPGNGPFRLRQVAGYPPQVGRHALRLIGRDAVPGPTPGIVYALFGVPTVPQDVAGDGIAQGAVPLLRFGNRLFISLPVQPQDLLVLHVPASFRFG